MALLNDKNLERKISNNNLVEFAREEVNSHQASQLKKRERLGGSESSNNHYGPNSNYNTVPAGIGYASKSSVSIKIHEENNPDYERDHKPDLVRKADSLAGTGSSSHGSSRSPEKSKFTVTPTLSNRERLIREVNQVKGRIKRQFPELQGDHDVLVIGAHDVGKSSLINSLWLSMTGETEERSPPVGKPYNFAAVPIYRRKATYSATSGIRLNGGSLQFWDTRGFQKIHKLSMLATLFRFILEGRMPPSYFHQALMLEEAKVIKNCKRIDISKANFYKAVVFIERERPTVEMEMQTQKLADALRLGLSRSKFHAVKTIPIIRVKNGAEREVKSLAKSQTITSVSSCESLCDVGMPARQHNIESYTWSVNYTDYDLDEIESDDPQEKSNAPNVERIPVKDAQKYYADHTIRNNTCTGNLNSSHMDISSLSQEDEVEENDASTSIKMKLGGDTSEDNDLDLSTGEPGQIECIQEESETDVRRENEQDKDCEDEEENEEEDEEEATDSGADTTENNNDNQFLLKMNIKPSNRFEFSYRLGPAVEELSPEKHLSLLLFLNNLLTIICHPESQESKKWRFDKQMLNKNNLPREQQAIGCKSAFKNMLMFNNRRGRTGN